MFNDFHESTRNVGIFGALLGLLLLAGLTGLGMAVFSGLENSPGKKVSVENKIVDQEATIDQETEKLAAREKELFKFKELAVIAGEVEDIKIELDLEERQVSKLEAEKAGLADDLVAEEQSFNDYRNRYRLAERKRAVGEVLDLSETKGDDYKECTVTGVSPIHLRIVRSSGSEGIPYQDLPTALRDRFQFGKDEAAGYQAVLNKATAAREKRAGEWNEKQKVEQAARDLENMSKKAAQNEVAAAAKRIEADRYRASSQEWKNKANQYRSEASQARVRGQITSKDGLARQADAQASRYGRSAIAADNEASRLEVEAAELRTRLAESSADE